MIPKKYPKSIIAEIRKVYAEGDCKLSEVGKYLYSKGFKNPKGEQLSDTYVWTLIAGGRSKPHADRYARTPKSVRKQMNQVRRVRPAAKVAKAEMTEPTTVEVEIQSMEMRLAHTIISATSFTPDEKLRLLRSVYGVA